MDGNLLGSGPPMDCPRLPALILDTIHPSGTIPPTSVRKVSFRALSKEDWCITRNLSTHSWESSLSSEFIWAILNFGKESFTPAK